MYTRMFNRFMTVIAGTTIALLLNETNSVRAFTLSTFSPVGFSDAVAGITGFTIEDFEDTTLISGLSIEWTSPNLGPVPVLPATYDPSGQSFFGNAWDGSFTLNNTRQGLYLQTPISSTTTFHFANPVTSIGLGISNVQFTGANSSTLLVNGVDFADFDTLIPAPILGPTGRSIYLRLDAGSHETITSIGIRGGVDDFLTFDRLAVNNAPSPSVPEPSPLFGLIFLTGVGVLIKGKSDRGKE